MPVEPLPCAPGDGSGGPGGTAGCCAPSIASTPLCLTDGTPIAVVVRAGCAECGAAPGEPQAVGWVDLATGAFTPGAAPAGAGPCPSGGGCTSSSLLRLCDLGADCVPFLRHLVRDCDGQVTAVVDTALDGTTPYTPVGEVVDCADCPCSQPEMCARLVGLSGPDSWSAPPGAESVGLSVVCGPVVVTDCAGESTRINECGLSLDWSAAGGPCGPGVLCVPLSVEALPGAAVYIRYLAPCSGGDES